MRSVLFCNEMLGLGHVRLSLALADALIASDRDSSALVVTGSAALSVLNPSERVDLVKLPSAPVDSSSMWSITGRQAPTGLVGEADRVRALRSELSLATVATFAPDVVVVDYRPLGRGGDLVAALEWCRVRGGCTTALGLWDVDDTPERLREQWTEELCAQTAELYDMALVYGPPANDDVRVQRLADAGLEVRVVGIVGASPAARAPAEFEPGYLLATVGGGADGLELLNAVLDALRIQPLDATTVIVAGPMMAAKDVAALRERAAGLDVCIERSRPDMGAMLAGARAVVAMAGYCTVAELLGAGKPAVLVPRAFPRAEQLNRARRLAENGRVELVEPAELSPERLSEALARVLAQPPFPRDPLTGAADAARFLLTSGAYP